MPLVCTVTFDDRPKGDDGYGHGMQHEINNVTVSTTRVMMMMMISDGLIVINWS